MSPEQGAVHARDVVVILGIVGDGGEDISSLTDNVSVWPAEGISAFGRAFDEDGRDAAARREAGTAKRGAIGEEGREHTSRSRGSEVMIGEVSGTGVWFPNRRLD